MVRDHGQTQRPLQDRPGGPWRAPGSRRSSSGSSSGATWTSPCRPRATRPRTSSRSAAPASTGWTLPRGRRGAPAAGVRPLLRPRRADRGLRRDGGLHAGLPRAPRGELAGADRQRRRLHAGAGSVARRPGALGLPGRHVRPARGPAVRPGGAGRAAGGGYRAARQKGPVVDFLRDYEIALAMMHYSCRCDFARPGGGARGGGGAAPRGGDPAGGAGDGGRVPRRAGAGRGRRHRPARRGGRRVHRRRCPARRRRPHDPLTCSLVSAMTGLMACGLTLEQVVPMVTSNPARMLGLGGEVGTLGARRRRRRHGPRGRSRRRSLRDNAGNQVAAEGLLQPAFCLRAGRRVAAAAPILAAATAASRRRGSGTSGPGAARRGAPRAPSAGRRAGALGAPDGRSNQAPVNRGGRRARKPSSPSAKSRPSAIRASCSSSWSRWKSSRSTPAAWFRRLFAMP